MGEEGEKGDEKGDGNGKEVVVMLAERGLMLEAGEKGLEEEEVVVRAVASGDARRWDAYSVALFCFTFCTFCSVSSRSMPCLRVLISSWRVCELAVI